MIESLQRVVIVGSSCAGKTTLASTLSKLLDVPHIELDSFYWGPNWQENPPEQFREDLQQAVSEPNWVCDGYYTFIRDVTWSRATTLIWLNYSFSIIFSRALRRTLSRIIHRTELYAGNRETFSSAFLSRNSFLIWVIKAYYERRRQMRKLLQEKEYSHLDVIQFRKPAETERFLAKLELQVQ